MQNMSFQLKMTCIARNMPKYAIKYAKYAKYVILKKICRICTPRFADAGCQAVTGMIAIFKLLLAAEPCHRQFTVTAATVTRTRPRSSPGGRRLSGGFRVTIAFRLG